MTDTIYDARDLNEVVTHYWKDLLHHFDKSGSHYFRPKIRCGGNGCAFVFEDEKRVLKFSLDPSEAKFYKRIDERKITSNAFCGGMVLGKITDALHSLSEESETVDVIEREYVLSLSAEERKEVSSIPAINFPPFTNRTKAQKIKIYELAKLEKHEIFLQISTTNTKLKKNLSASKKAELYELSELLDSAYVIATWRSRLEYYLEGEHSPKAVKFVKEIMSLIEQGVYLVDLQADNVGIKDNEYCLFDVGLSEVILF